MNRRQSFEDSYKVNAPAVLSSIAKVAAAARWGDQAKIELERQRHRRLMESLP